MIYDIKQVKIIWENTFISLSHFVDELVLFSECRVDELVNILIFSRRHFFIVIAYWLYHFLVRFIVYLIIASRLLNWHLVFFEVAFCHDLNVAKIFMNYYWTLKKGTSKKQEFSNICANHCISPLEEYTASPCQFLLIILRSLVCS